MSMAEIDEQALIRCIQDDIRARNWDLVADCSQIRAHTQSAVRLRMGDAADPLVEAAVAAVWSAIAPFGPLQPFIDDPSVEEVWVNHDDRVFISRDGCSELTCAIISQADIALIVERMVRYSKRRVDARHPFVDATLPDGSRVHAVIPSITRRSIAVNVRKFPRRALTLDDFRESGTITAGQHVLLQQMLARGDTIVVSGATNSGKTTMVRALLGSLPAATRVVTCEEVFELAPDVVDVVSMQTRAAAVEGDGEISLRRLVVEALRMRPDVLAIGEVRQAEAFELLIALNSGVRGFCTIHANSAMQAMRKLATLPLLAGSNVTSAFVVPALAESIDAVIHMSRDTQGRRKVVEIAEIAGVADGEFVLRRECSGDEAA